ncbi:rRNA 2'-O-methyltransferase fibrillarin 2 [Linum perenne]
MAANLSYSFFDDEVVVVEPHKFEGVFIAKGKNNDAICTKNLVPGEAVNVEELISVKNKVGIKTEYRIWDPSRSKLAAAIRCGVENIWVKPGSRVLYIGDVCETTVSHLSDLVGPDGLVYAVGSSDAVVNMAEKRSNVIPVYTDYSAPMMYLMLVSMVDVICADLEDPLKVYGPIMKVRGLAMNALHFLRAGGHFLVFTQADSIVPTSENGVAIESLRGEEKREFNILEMIKLEQDHKGNPTKELIDFLVGNLPEEMSVPGGAPISCSNGMLAGKIARRLKLSLRVGSKEDNILRGLRSNICEFFGKKPAELEKFQRDLALSLARQRRKSTYKGNFMAANSSSSFFDDEVVVEPHKFEGVYIAKGKNDDAICTENLVPGEAVNGEELISVKNKDGIETEYRIWDPSRSKLAAAIQCGVENIWVKPGSRVLYIGDVCETTVSHLSDLVGLDGLIYSVGSSDAVVNMAEKRSNVIPIYYGYGAPMMYLMLVSMVDVICADLKDPLKMYGQDRAVIGLAMNAQHFLRAGGHFLAFTQADSIVPTSENGVAIESLRGEEKREFNILEMIELEQDHKGLVMVGGCYRKLDA